VAQNQMLAMQKSSLLAALILLEENVQNCHRFRSPMGIKESHRPNAREKADEVEQRLDAGQDFRDKTDKTARRRQIA